ncbi:hypothetical protein ACHAWF_011098 [Thalassiosira exigua]
MRTSLALLLAAASSTVASSGPRGRDDVPRLRHRRRRLNKDHENHRHAGNGGKHHSHYDADDKKGDKDKKDDEDNKHVKVDERKGETRTDDMHMTKRKSTDPPTNSPTSSPTIPPKRKGHHGGDDAKPEFDAIDLDGDGKIEYEEVESFATKLGLSIKRADLVEMFESADKDHDGVISAEEFGDISTSSSCRDDSDCESEVCVRKWFFYWYGRCKDCRYNSQCAAQVTQPPAGEYGNPFCVDNECVAHLHGESRITEEGYLTWIPSETSDNSASFPKIPVPRRVLGKPGPVFDQVWYIDLNEQEESFNKDDVRVNDTHIHIPTFTPIQAGYSKSFHQYEEHETGISTLFAGDNEVSVVSPFPKAVFVEKVHTLTYDGIQDTSRGDFIKQKSNEALSEPWAQNSWLAKALNQFVITGLRETIPSEIEAGVDHAIAWQTRRFANSYQDDGSLNPTTSTSWASHTEKAQQAIVHAKNPDFHREYPKSEQICYHLEEGFGVDASDTHITLPLGRPSTTLSGQMVNSPVHYLGFTVGYFTVHYDEINGILQLYFQAYSSSRQYTDVRFPGPPTPTEGMTPKCS